MDPLLLTVGSLKSGFPPTSTFSLFASTPLVMRPRASEEFYMKYSSKPVRWGGVGWGEVTSHRIARCSPPEEDALPGTLLQQPQVKG